VTKYREFLALFDIFYSNNLPAAENFLFRGSVLLKLGKSSIGET